MKNYEGLKKNNGGYTLVEMIIVLAIVAVLSSAALISVTVINSAKAKDASVTFDSEIATLLTKSKNTVCTYDADGDGDDEEHLEYQHCLWIYRDDTTYYVMKGFYDTSNGTYIFNSNTDSSNGGKGKSLSAYVTIRCATDSGDTVIDENGLYIRYTRGGTCIEGVGSYDFYKRNGNVVAHVVLRKNGSHELR